MLVAKEESVLQTKHSLDVNGALLGLITLNRPNQMNPLDWTTVKKMHETLLTFAEDSSVRVIAITGAGKAFSAGGDLKAYLTLQRSETKFQQFLDDIHATFNEIESIPKPVIALVNGVSAAGGTEILLSCDFAYAATSARIGDGHLNFGQMGGGGVLTRAPRRILPGRARELLFTGEFLSAEAACQWGLVNRVVPREMLMTEAMAFANAVADKSPLAVANMKRVINEGLQMKQEDALHLEKQTTHHYCLTSYDAPEGLKAFSEKRQPKYQGR